MFCEKCGSPVKETERFCAKCGAPINMETTVPGAGTADGQGTGTENTAAGQGGNAQIPLSEAGKAADMDSGAVAAIRAGAGKIFNKKHKVFLLAAAGVLLLLILVLTNFARLNNFLHKTFSSPAKYYQFVEKQTVEELAGSVAALYDVYILDMLNIYDKSGSMEIAIDLTEDGQEFLELAGLTGVELSWLKSAAVEGNYNIKNEMLSFGTALRMNQDDIVSGSLIMDMGGESLYVQIPELTKTYLGIDMEDSLSSYQRWQLEEFMEQQAEFLKLQEALPNKSDVEQLVEKYTKLALSCVQDVTIGQKTLKAEGVQQKCTELKIKIDAETLQEMQQKILEEMLDDKDIREIIRNVAVFSGTDGDYAYDMFLQSIEYSLQYPGYVDEDAELIMKLYVDGKGGIRGRSIEWEDYYDTMTVSVIMPESGSKFGYELSAESEGESIKLVGSGRKSGNKVTGDFQLKYNGTSLIDIGVTKLNVKSLKAGQLEGSFEVSASSQMGTVAGYMPGMFMMQDMKFTLEADTGADSGKAALGIAYDGEKLGTISITYKKGSGSKVSLPSGKSVVMVEGYEDLMDWLETIDWDNVISRLDKTDLPSSIVDTIEYIGEELEDGNFVELYRYLYYLY